MAKEYRCPLEPRGYELDSYGHVNNAVYVSYLEHARWKLLEEENIRLEDFNRWKSWPVVAHLEVDYLKPVHMGDALEIRSTVVGATRSSFDIEQRMFRLAAKPGEPATEVLRAKVRAVMVNESGRPMGILPEIRRMWEGSLTEAGS